MNIPNALTILRMLLVPTYCYFMYAGFAYASIWAAILFGLAALTDLADGYIARKYNLITNFGKVMDPVADKIMVAAAMIVLVDLHRLAAWIVIVMLFRDFAVGALRDVAASKGDIIAAGIWGKLKTALQMTALSMIIFYEDLLFLPTYTVGMIVMYFALAASIYSGVVYFQQYMKVFKK